MEQKVELIDLVSHTEKLLPFHGNIHECIVVTQIQTFFHRTDEDIIAPDSLHPNASPRVCHTDKTGPVTASQSVFMCLCFLVSSTNPFR